MTLADHIHRTAFRQPRWWQAESREPCTNICSGNKTGNKLSRNER
jgi:hypothetical protein